MEWIVKIDKRPNRRVLVGFIPLKEGLHFLGQYKPQGKPWVTFVESPQPATLDREGVVNVILDVYEHLVERITLYKASVTIFGEIKSVEMNIENDEEERDIEPLPVKPPKPLFGELMDDNEVVINR